MNEESVLVNEMIQEIARIEYQNSEVIQKYRELEHRIKAIRFRCMKNVNPFNLLKKILGDELIE